MRNKLLYIIRQDNHVIIELHDNGAKHDYLSAMATKHFNKWQKTEHRLLGYKSCNRVDNLHKPVDGRYRATYELIYS